jgi:phage terminase large subunit
MLSLKSSWGLLDEKRSRVSFGLRSAYDNFLLQRSSWATFCGGKKEEVIPEPMTEYQGKFPEFCREVLGVEPYPIQEKIAKSVEENEKTTVSACYASGKTFTAACLLLYWLFTRRPSIVVTTAPTDRQVKMVLWREIRKLYKGAKKILKGKLLQAKLELEDNWQAFGFSCDGGNTAAGFHESENVLFLIEEAAGVSQEVYEGFDGITTGINCRTLMIGNPLCSVGPFIDSHLHPVKSKEWNQIKISALDTPNVIKGETVVKGLVEKKWVDSKRIIWGENSPLWRMKVLGEFVLVSLEKVIPESWVEMAHKNWEELGGKSGGEGERILGFDVAGGGKDETMAYVRHGRIIYYLKSWSIGDHDVIFKELVELIINEKINVVCVDGTVIGKGLADRLAGATKEDDFGNPGILDGVGVIRAYSNEKTEEPEHYANKPSEMAFKMRAAFNPENPEQVACDPNDTELTKELSDRVWTLDERRLVKIESKREMIKRGAKSPDRSDAVNLTFARGRLAVA